MLSCHESNSELGCGFEIVHDGSVDAQQRRQLTSVVEGTTSTVRFHSVGRERIETLPSTQDFGTIVWLRFFLPEVLSDQSRVLYLDSDTFVAGPITELWNAPLEGHPIGAVANVVEPAVREHVRQLGIDYPGGFFNSGVLLMDLAAMRQNRSTDRLLAFATSNADRLLWPDQDTLNVVFDRNWTSLHPKWNAQNSYWTWRGWALEVFGEQVLGEALADPRVRHFEGPSLSKPWHYLCSAPMFDDYRAAMRRSAWSSLPLADRTLTTSLIRLLPPVQRVAAYKRLMAARQRANRWVARHSKSREAPQIH